jgi:hypothetical protein
MRSRDSTFVDRLALVHQKDGFEVSWRAPIGNKTAYLAANHQPRKSQEILTLPAHANGLCDPRDEVLGPSGCDGVSPRLEPSLLGDLPIG